MTAWAIIREARHRAGLTQRELAHRARTAQSEIARIERGHQDPRFETLLRLVRAAGFDLRIRLVPYTDVGRSSMPALTVREMRTAISEMLALTPDERLERLEGSAGNAD